MATALQVAQSQVGVQEQPKGSNSGPEVNAYLKSVNLGPGYAWCQAFVHWCYEQAAGIGCPVVKTGGVLLCWNNTSTAKKVMVVEAKQRPELIEPGMQFVMQFAHGTGHTGIVEKVDAAARLIHTIEGNTNDDGSREGYEVARRVRAIDHPNMLGYIRY